MKRTTLISAAVAVMATTLLTGCLVAPVQPPMGLLYTSHQAPLFADQTTGEVGSKSGMSNTTSILGLVAWGDGSLQTAAENGGISNIRHVDYKYDNIIGVYQKYTTIARGE
jgi:hypothetical protein